MEMLGASLVFVVVLIVAGIQLRHGLKNYR